MDVEEKWCPKMLGAPHAIVILNSENMIKQCMDWGTQFSNKVK